MNITIDLERDKLLDEYAVRIIKDRYLIEGETSPQHAFARAAKAFADDEAHAQRIYDYVSKLWFMFSTPILANGGTKRGMPISCFLQYVEDSLDGIIEHEAESSYLAANGGGLGAAWSALRTNKTKTSRGGESTGMIPFVAQFDRKVLAYRQAGTRRAAYAAYLDISHPEIVEFVNIRKPSGGDINRKATNIHHGVNITDDFMRKLYAEDDSWELKDPHTHKVIEVVSARELWQQILTLRMETGEPYLHFIDASNRALPEVQKALSLCITTSNLCVAPETLVLTKQGYKGIKSLQNETTLVWNGEEWSEVEVKQTAANAKVITVTFSDGSSIDCTPEHNFYVQNEYSKKAVKTPAHALVPGDKLEKWDLPVDVAPAMGAEDNAPDAYTQGFYCGDGNYDLPYSWVYEPKYVCLPRLKGSVSDSHVAVERVVLKHGAMFNKFFVPLGYSNSYKLDWLAGFLDADGCVIESDNCDNIQLVSSTPSVIREVKLMLQEMGVHSAVVHRRPAGKYMLPANDGSNSLKEFDCAELWLLNINGVGTKRLLEMGLKCERLEFSTKQEPNRDASKFVKVVSIEDKNRVTDTYCFTEQKRGRGMFNGVVTGNCSEITLATNTERTAVCCLSSVNLEKWDEWKDTNMVADLIRMLDNVLDVFIKAEHVKPSVRHAIRKAIYSAERERSLGLGAMGFHAYLQSKMIPFGSAEAHRANIEMFTKIRAAAEEATMALGARKGSYPDYAEYYAGKDVAHFERRNAHLLAIAPNASSSILCGNTSPGIEPYAACIYAQKTENGTNVTRNKWFQAMLENKGLSKEEQEEIWRSINAAKGSCQHLPILDPHEKEVFKTAEEIDQRWVIEHAAVRQRYIDQAQSINLFFKTPVDVTYLHEVHYSAWEKGLKTLYYVRSVLDAKTEDIGKKVERKHLVAQEEPFVQTKFKATLPGGHEIACVGCD